MVEGAVADVGNELAWSVRGRRCTLRNVKRVASAVGEGSITIHLVHRVLAEMSGAYPA
jgi:hypothetical protein